MEEDENLKVLMSSLRGQNLSDSDFAAEGVEMRLVMMDSDEGEGLPLEYDPVIIGDYWGRRPGGSVFADRAAVVNRRRVFGWGGYGSVDWKVKRE